MPENIGIGPAELHGIHLFRSFSDQEVQRLAALFEPVGVNEGEILFTQGEAADAFYLLMAGEVSLRQDEREVYLLKPPCLIGELGASTGLLRHCRAVVGPGTVVRRIDAARLHDFCSHNPDIGLPFYRALLTSAADKIAHDQRRMAEMREHIIVTQKAMKGMRDFVLESPDSPISRRIHDTLEGLIQQNRRANYRVEPPPSLAASFRLDDGRVADVVELSRTHVNLRMTGALPAPGGELAGVLVLAGPESQPRAAFFAFKGTGSSLSWTFCWTNSPPFSRATSRGCRCSISSSDHVQRCWTVRSCPSVPIQPCAFRRPSFVAGAIPAMAP